MGGAFEGGGPSKRNLPVIPDRRLREITINEAFYLIHGGGAFQMEVLVDI